MSVEAVGNPPPEADQIRLEIEAKLPEIISSFSQVLQQQFGFNDLQVGGFTVVPRQESGDKISCDEDGCSIT
ncbi:MAG: hypothetical protein F6K30_05195 [Cyanothece sp. SIO2G6]|nr:hypothetical protein [Cyanothece sp. SIO2G6]